MSLINREDAIKEIERIRRILLSGFPEDHKGEPKIAVEYGMSAIHATCRTISALILLMDSVEE